MLSVAPLLGAAAAVDAGHARWLHVHVRPPARGLLKTVRVRGAHTRRRLRVLAARVPSGLRRSGLGQALSLPSERASAL